MAKLIDSAIGSLDGYVEDAGGGFDWAAPDEDVHVFVNELERSIGTYLYGRRMYETMLFWETAPSGAGVAPALGDYAEIWRAAEKIVYSRSLESPSSARTRVERRFDPDAVRRIKDGTEANISVGGPDLAAQAIAAGLVDEYHLFLVPVVIGGGKRSLPEDVRLELELLGERRFVGGVVHLHYRTRP